MITLNATMEEMVSRMNNGWVQVSLLHSATSVTGRGHHSSPVFTSKSMGRDHISFRLSLEAHKLDKYIYISIRSVTHPLWTWRVRGLPWSGCVWPRAKGQCLRTHTLCLRLSPPTGEMSPNVPMLVFRIPFVYISSTSNLMSEYKIRFQFNYHVLGQCFRIRSHVYTKNLTFLCVT